MNRITYLLFLCFSSLLAISSNAQTKQQVFVQITDAAGQTIRGTSTVRFYEKQIIATNFSGVTTGNPEVRFSIPSGAASATLANSQGNKTQLPQAVFTTTQPGEQGLIVLNTVRLEEVTVINTEDVNGSTHVTLRANRIGTTHYQYDRKRGSRTVSGKNGYDFRTGTSWTAF